MGTVLFFLWTAAVSSLYAQCSGNFTLLCPNMWVCFYSLYWEVGGPFQDKNLPFFFFQFSELKFLNYFKGPFCCSIFPFWNMYYFDVNFLDQTFNAFFFPLLFFMSCFFSFFHIFFCWVFNFYYILIFTEAFSFSDCSTFILRSTPAFSFIRSFISFFSKYLSSAYYVPGTCSYLKEIIIYL